MWSLLVCQSWLAVNITCFGITLLVVFLSVVTTCCFTRPRARDWCCRNRAKYTCDSLNWDYRVEERGDRGGEGRWEGRGGRWEGRGGKVRGEGREGERGGEEGGKWCGGTYHDGYNLNMAISYPADSCAIYIRIHILILQTRTNFPGKQKKLQYALHEKREQLKKKYSWSSRLSVHLQSTH